MASDLVELAYRRYAHVYDILFGPLFEPGRRALIASLNLRPGERVLDVGVGTGLSLPLYPASSRVTAIDSSAEMVALARERVKERSLGQVEQVLKMDGEAMSFADGMFDKVVAMYVVSVVARPLQLIAEMRRVCKPGGDLYIVNHFRSRHALPAPRDELSAFAAVAGFRADLDLNAFIAGSGLTVVDAHETNVFGRWTILHCRNSEALCCAT
jgi:phosphatidylethanolamine/phosphatidyl-N-methylethanolamine N-methyltransferase